MFKAAETTIEVLLRTDAGNHERLVAALLDHGAEAFAEGDETLRAYFPARTWTEKRRATVQAVLQGIDPRGTLDVREIPPRNWNEEWEATLTPVLVEPFLITPSTRPIPEEDDALYVLQIDPKMSFGTGHHESTRLILRMLSAVIKQGSLVLDAGSGTGVLAIAAARLGARRIVAFDIDPHTEENIRENVATNGVDDRVEIFIGTLDDAPSQLFDVITANINHDALLNYMGGFSERLDPDGYLLMSGLLTTDRDTILQAIADHGMMLVDERSEGDWWAVSCALTTN